MSRVIVRDLVNKFNWTVVSGDAKAFERPVLLADTNRPGLELAGYFPDSQSKRIVILGDKEIGYIEEQMDEISQRRSFEFLTADTTPCIIITHGHPCPSVLEEIATRKNFPVFRTESATSHMIVSIINYLDECLAESIIIHGELVRVYGVGVLITGRSGMGKSEIALELIKRGHQLVGDDRIDCFKIHDELIGRTTPMLEGFMELRGVGIINVARMYGVGAVAHQTKIDFQIDLEPFNDKDEYDRVGIEEKEYNEFLGIRILKVTIPVSQGRPMSSVIETAVTNYLLLKDGLDSAKEFEARVLAQIHENKEEEDGAIS